MTGETLMKRSSVVSEHARDSPPRSENLWRRAVTRARFIRPAVMIAALPHVRDEFSQLALVPEGLSLADPATHGRTRRGPRPPAR